MVKLSIIIVNYNARDFLKQCLNSLYESICRLSFEIIVVDNHSDDDSCAMIKREFPQVRLIENSRNTGFAGGNNVGISAARGLYILLLNSDTKVIGDALEKMVIFLDEHPEVAVVTSRLVYPDFSDQGVARTFPTPMNALFGRRSLLTRLFPNNKYSRKYLVSRSYISDVPFEIDWVSGACLMARKGVMEEVGLLDEKFFMYWEDADLCLRIKKKGWLIFCVPEARVIHYEGKSTKRKSRSRLIIEFNKSAYRYYRKHHIKSFFEFMNFVAIVGISVRTLVLLVVDTISEGKFNVSDNREN